MRPFLAFLAFAIATLGALAHPFEGAKWIGADSTALPFYADYLPIYQIETQLTKGDFGGIAFGGNDPRLRNGGQNVWGIDAPADSSYMSVTVNRATGKVLAMRHFHTKGKYHELLGEYSFVTDSRSPIDIKVRVNLGKTDIYVNGKLAGSLNMSLNPAGGDYNPYPMLCQAGFVSNKHASQFSDLVISNFREPGAELARIKGGKIKGKRLFDIANAGVPMLRTSIACTKPIRKATMAMAVRGIADVYGPNGRITDEYFAPGASQYDKTQYFINLDLTDHLAEGDNPIGIVLGEGWWCGGATFVGENWNFFGDRPSVIAKITVHYKDGDSLVVATDPRSWQVSTNGPVRYGSFFQGEVYDARRENANWLTDNSLGWKAATEIPGYSAVQFLPRHGNRIREVAYVTAVSVTESEPNVYVYDLGQNIAGVPEIHLTGMPAGKQIGLRFAEVLYPHLDKYGHLQGKIMTENLRMAQCHDLYTTKAGDQTIAPRFTYHGFRYIEISGLDAPLPLSSVNGVAISSMGEPTAGFRCSDSLVNKLWDNTLWSTRANFMSIPTDCPQRNERLGWAGDISVFSRTATYLANCNEFLYDYLRAMRDLQQPSGEYPEVAPTGFGFGGLLWELAGVTVPYQAYRQWGDSEALAQHFPSMHAYMQFVEKEYIDPASGEIVQRHQWGDLGDWLSPEHDRNDKPLIWECYYIHALNLMQDMGRELGLDSLAAVYAQKAKERTLFFNSTYINRKGQTIHGGIDPKKKGKLVDTQTSYALPLAFGIVNDSKKEAFVRNFVNTIKRPNTTDDGTACAPFGLFTGFIGTAHIMDALSATGNDDIAYKLLTNREYPSWLYPVTQGATTIWERLNSYTHTDGFGSNNSMNSFNHYSFGSVCSWLLENCAGIRRHIDGSFTIAPTPDPTGAMTWAEGYYLAPQGKITVRWQRGANGDVTYTATMPKGVEATLLLPQRRPIPLPSGTSTYTIKNL